ncbi:MAG TPA: RidA family protein [Aggregatilinea sp.]|jgi:enamine deaminase RidA (YjgF/YER057c/UK114 family)|uniref:RidA family protein n=1 Tax=Aggregatilinea sp. TaxID=2806333 RepID=UPI002BAAB99F|nr:RidA family protein [Aggregatilinea sp.]HML23690.1 RidA family protein [Aggregatilinea sp.]
MPRQNISSGSPWEPVVGYSRAVRIGSIVRVAGTTATDEAGQVIGPGDPYVQTRAIFEKVGRALAEAGASFSDVIATRMFVTDISRWEEIARAHNEVFHDIRPAATMVQVQALISPELMVEIEVEAVLDRE